MRVDRFITLELMSRLGRAGAAAARPRLPVLMYHSISDDPESTVKDYYKVSTSPQSFALHLQCLAELGLKGVTLETALHSLATDSAAASRQVAITFDDGFRNFYTQAWPILKRFGCAATMYLPTDYIAADRKQFRNQDCMNWDEVRELHASGIGFGSHTVNHPKLYSLTWSEIETELTESRRRIEAELGEPIHSFAYPFAFPQEDRAFVAQLSHLLRKSGYTSCATTIVGRLGAEKAPFLIRRLPVNSSDDQRLFAAKLHGYYDWMVVPQGSFRWGRAVAQRMRSKVRAGQSSLTKKHA